MAQARVAGQNFDVVVLADPTGAISYPGASVSDDARGFSRQIPGAAQKVDINRLPTTTAGQFLNNGNVNITNNGTVGTRGDYLDNIKYEAKAGTRGGKSGIFVTQLSDSPFAAGNAGTAPAGGTAAITLTAGAALTATANQLADRVVSFKYTPTGAGLGPEWFTTRIVSHAAISTTSLALTVEDMPDAGGAITEWIIHGLSAFRALDPATPAGTGTIQLGFEAKSGGLVGWVGSNIVKGSFYGAFTG